MRHQSHHRNNRFHRSVVLPPPHPDAYSHIIGEIDAGIVTGTHIAGWDGSTTALPATCTGDLLTDPIPVGVLAGRVIVFEGVDYVESVDTVTGARTRITVPPRPRRFPADPRWKAAQQYNAAGTWMIVAEYLGGCLIAGDQGQLRYLDRSLAGDDVLWYWSGDVVIMWDSARRGTVSYDSETDVAGPAPYTEYNPATNTFTPLTYAPNHGTIPRLDITGRTPWPPTNPTAP